MSNDSTRIMKAHGATIKAKLPALPPLWSRRELWKVPLPFPNRTRQPGQLEPLSSRAAYMSAAATR